LPSSWWWWYRLRLGGSALAQAYAQQGNETPNLTRSDLLGKAFKITQSLLVDGLLKAGHDVSDGELIVCLLEMAIGGLSGLRVELSEPLKSLKSYDAAVEKLDRPELALHFAEECGWVVEILDADLERVRSIYNDAGVPNYYLGLTDGFGLDSRVVVKHGASELLNQPLRLVPVTSWRSCKPIRSALRPSITALNIAKRRSTGVP